MTFDEFKDSEVPLARAKRDAEHDPILAGMIRRGVPLTRSAYLILSHGDPDPEEWTHEHEEGLPDCFQHPGAVKPHPGKKGSHSPF